MSDDYDKEAEREKLRQQLEREEASREASQRMSDLLLKGATMTNKHCGECGDPIFRQDGQEFCPTCQRPVANTQTEDAAADAGPSPPDTDRSEGGGVDSIPDARDDGRAPTGATAEEPDAAPTDVSRDQAATRQSVGETPERPSRRPPDGDVGEARAALVRTLTTLAREAEAAEDVRRARDLLAAAREAAEALAAIDDVNR